MHIYIPLIQKTMSLSQQCVTGYKNHCHLRMTYTSTRTWMLCRKQKCLPKIIYLSLFGTKIFKSLVLIISETTHCRDLYLKGFPILSQNYSVSCWFYLVSFHWWQCGLRIVASGLLDFTRVGEEVMWSPGSWNAVGALATAGDYLYAFYFVHCEKENRTNKTKKALCFLFHRTTNKVKI